MSGLVAIWRRDGAPVAERAVEGVMTALAHRAIDGRRVWAAPGGSAVLGHLHFWTTPEELGEAQPLVIGDTALVFDGRLDNRPELATALGAPAAGETATGETAAGENAPSDAALALLAYRRWGDGFVKRLAGPFAVVVWDGHERRVLCGRDHLGRRSLFYRIDARTLIVASEPGAVLACDGSEGEFDEVFLAHYFAVRSAPDGHTLFKAVRELPPGHTLVVDDTTARCERYWVPHLAPIRYRSDDQYFEHFVELLDRAVQRRMRAPTVPGIMMSGGMDSTSVAALAARQLERDAPGQRLKVYSYVFDELVDLDERQWMQPMVEMYGLDQTLVKADDAWPLSDIEQWPWNPSGPDTGAFRALNSRLYTAARQDGLRVLLTGSASDALFINGHSSWLADLVADGRYSEATTEILKHVQDLGPMLVLRSQSVRRLIGKMVRRPMRPLVPPRWLAPDAARRLQPSADRHLLTDTPRHPSDALAVWEALNLSNGMGADYYGYKARIEVRDPFSDMELVEYAMSVPAYMLYNRGTHKYLLHRSMSGALPPEILTRLQRSNISPLYWRGIGQKGAPTVQQMLSQPEPLWRRFVEPSALRQGTNDSSTTGALALLVWYCVSIEWWRMHRPGTLMRSPDRS